MTFPSLSNSIPSRTANKLARPYGRTITNPPITASLTTSNAPDILIGRLAGMFIRLMAWVLRTAIEIHAPCVGRGGPPGSGRPIVCGLSGREIGFINSGIVFGSIDNREEFFDVGEPPVALACQRQGLTRTQRFFPSHFTTRGAFLPDQPCFCIGGGIISVIRKGACCVCASNAPGILGIGLTEVAHGAMSYAHVPRFATASRVGSGPIVARGISASKIRRVEGPRLPKIHNRLQLMDLRDPPVALPTEAQAGAIGCRICPGAGGSVILPLPHQEGVVVCNRITVVNDEGRGIDQVIVILTDDTGVGVRLAGVR